MMAGFFAKLREEVTVTLPAARGDLIAAARRDGQVLSEEYHNGSVHVRALVTRPMAGRLRKASAQSRGEVTVVSPPCPIRPRGRPSWLNPAPAAASSPAESAQFPYPVPDRLDSVLRRAAEQESFPRGALSFLSPPRLTDSLDGTLARWTNSRTELGAFLDPFADKLLLISAFVILTVEDVIPGWVLSVIAVRDVVVVFGYLMLVFWIGERMPVRPTYIGKAGTVLEIACIVTALLGLARIPRSRHCCGRGC